MLIALASTIVFFTVLALVITNAPGWPAVKATFFDWSQFKSTFPEILHAFKLNVKIFLIAEVLILVVALGAGGDPQPAGAGLLPAPRARDRLRRLLPRRARPCS